MDLLKRLGRRGFARNQKATVFQYLKGIMESAVPNCEPFSLYIRLHLSASNTLELTFNH